MVTNESVVLRSAEVVALDTDENAEPVLGDDGDAAAVERPNHTILPVCVLVCTRLVGIFFALLVMGNSNHQQGRAGSDPISQNNSALARPTQDSVTPNYPACCGTTKHASLL